MKDLRRAILLAASITTASLSHGQQPASPALKPLAFLSGRWINTTPTEFQEENWSPPSGDSMLGSFRVVDSGKPVFYEFWVVELDDDRPVLKLKHFNVNLSGWEEKNASTKMPLVSISADDVVFAESDGSVSLHYHRQGDLLTCTVRHVKNGQSNDESFALTKASDH